MPVYTALSPTEWVRLWTYQDGKCAICTKPLRNRYDKHDTLPSPAFCDHSHVLEKTKGVRASVRGLLCLYCNRYILVVLHDSVEKAQRAADYLRDPPARRILKLEEPPR